MRGARRPLDRGVVRHNQSLPGLEGVDASRRTLHLPSGLLQPAATYVFAFTAFVVGHEPALAATAYVRVAVRPAPYQPRIAGCDRLVSASFPPRPSLCCAQGKLGIPARNWRWLKGYLPYLSLLDFLPRWSFVAPMFLFCLYLLFRLLTWMPEEDYYDRDAAQRSAERERAALKKQM